MATKVTIPASLGVSKPRVAPFEGLLDEVELGVDPVLEGTVEEELVAAALALNSSMVSLVVGLMAKTIPALQWAPFAPLQ